MRLYFWGIISSVFTRRIWEDFDDGNPTERVLSTREELNRNSLEITL